MKTESRVFMKKNKIQINYVIKIESLVFMKKNKIQINYVKFINENFEKLNKSKHLYVIKILVIWVVLYGCEVWVSSASDLQWK
jgi:hypothetical protein